MTLTVELSRDLEKRLTTEAARLGLPLEQYALRLLGGLPESPGLPSTGADLVAYWQREGVIGSSPEIQDSRAHARALRMRAERRTFNTKHFRTFPDLLVEQPHER